jgi:hypothetical protein
LKKGGNKSVSDNTRKALALMRQELAKKEREVAELRQAVESLARLNGLAGHRSAEIQPKSQEYADLRPTEAVRRFLAKVGKPQSTRQIADALLDGGIQTKAKNFTASIYATLTNAEKEFGRVGNTWVLNKAPNRSKRNFNKSEAEVHAPAHC